MDQQTAIRVFRALEEERITEMQGDPPTYEVRIDAGTDSAGDRTFRVRVKPVSYAPRTDSLRFVLDIASGTLPEIADELEVQIQNDALELR